MSVKLTYPISGKTTGKEVDASDSTPTQMAYMALTNPGSSVVIGTLPAAKDEGSDEGNVAALK